MEYQKIIHLLNNIPNQPSKFRTKNWVEINDDARGTYNKNNQIKFKTSMLKSSLCDYSDAYILVSGNIIVDEAEANDAAKRLDERNKGVIFGNYAPFIDCKNEIPKTQIEYTKDLDVVMLMYNVIEYSDNYSKTSKSLWQYYRDEPNYNVVGPGSFKCKINITRKTRAAGNKKNVRIGVSLKYLNSFW